MYANNLLTSTCLYISVFTTCPENAENLALPTQFSIQQAQCSTFSTSIFAASEILNFSAKPVYELKSPYVPQYPINHNFRSLPTGLYQFHFLLLTIFLIQIELPRLAATLLHTSHSLIWLISCGLLGLCWFSFFTTSLIRVPETASNCLELNFDPYFKSAPINLHK